MYSTLEVNRGLHAARLLRHFEQTAGGFRVVERLRRHITWRTCNLLEPWCHDDTYHLILCRNVLIYFSPDDRERVIQRLYSVVRPNGCIGVGATETIQGVRLSPGWYTREKVVER